MVVLPSPAGWADSGDEDQLCLAGQLADLGQVELGLVVAVELEVLFIDAGLGGDFGDLFHFMGLSDLNVGHGEYLLNNYVFKSGELSLIDKINYSRTIEKGKLFCKPLFSKNLKKLSIGSRALKRKNGRFLDEFSTLAAKVKTRKAKVASARLSFHSCRVTA